MTIEQAKVTVSITFDEMLARGLDPAALVARQAERQGVPVHLVEPERVNNPVLPHVADFTWRWYVLDKLPDPEPQSDNNWARSGYDIRWGSVGLWSDVLDNYDSPIHVIGLGSLSIEAAERLALEILAAAVHTKHRFTETEGTQGNA